MNHDSILVTGGAGFIGSNFIRQWYSEEKGQVVNLDILTPSVSLGCRTVCGDICNASLVRDLFASLKPRAIVHFAAETHVDRSLDGSSDFVYTNVMGTHVLLDEALRYWTDEGKPPDFRFVHISTDEVYGDIEHGFAREDAPLRPNNPYSATKAGADCLVRAYHKSHGLPTLTTVSANNYGPYQFPDKLIPLMILNALDGKLLPIYGDGLQERDWIYVEDNCRAICAILQNGVPGERYNIGTGDVRKNVSVVWSICDAVDSHDAAECLTGASGRSWRLVTYVPDRPGHDRRYALNTAKLDGIIASRDFIYFGLGIEKTVQWYSQNRQWCEVVTKGKYGGERLGLGKTDKRRVPDIEGPPERN